MLTQIQSMGLSGLALMMMLAVLAAAGTTGCSGRRVLLELNASVLYDKPVIESIAYSVDDRRREGSGFEVQVTLRGDTGLDASFDISPGLAEAQPMSETGTGTYVGRLTLPQDLVGGPFSVVGRLRHDRAGEVIVKDPTPLTISLYR